jgi:predicted MFS family arabinose efflux permease
MTEAQYLVGVAAETARGTVDRLEPLPLRRYVITATTARIVTEATAITLVLLGTERGIDERRLGVLVACWTLPQLVTAPIVGSLADRSRRPATLLAALVLVGGLGIGAVGAGLGVVPLAALCAVSALISLAEPAIMGGLSGLASRSAAGVGGFSQWDAVSYGAAGISAQLVVSVSAALTTPAVTLWLVVAMAAIATVLVSQLPLRAATTEHEPVDIARVVRLLFGDRELRSITVLTTIALSAFGGLALASVDLAEHLGRRSTDGSRLVLALAIGSVAGSLITTRIATPAHPLRTAAVSVATIGICFGLAAVSAWPIALCLFATAGVADAPLLVATFASRTRRSPDEARASVYTVAASLKIAATSIGALAVGFVTASAGGGSGVATLAAIEAVALAAFGVTRYVGRP